MTQEIVADNAVQFHAHRVAQHLQKITDYDIQVANFRRTNAPRIELRRSSTTTGGRSGRRSFPVMRPLGIAVDEELLQYIETDLTVI